jgi:beta-galactosidase GanA
MFKAEKPYFGAAYYPESWDREQVDEDIRLMKEMGMNTVRIAEFAGPIWNRPKAYTIFH